ncbi:MAG: hypothetical protein HQL17_02100 [Candidatus Omnitrophica bacterium]|nr:hypothetical protein [Candidatus Omnitrophota bacterium]
MISHCHDRRLIGEVLVERALITDIQLERALFVQKTEGGGYLGNILVRLGFVQEIDIVTALVLQCNLPYISISKYAIDPNIAALIPPDVAHRDRLIPLDKIGNILSVVMQNPLDDDMRSKVETMTGCRIAIFISTREEIDQALIRLYPSGGR